jgi:hypothetical protein
MKLMKFRLRGKLAQVNRTLLKFTETSSIFLLSLRKLHTNTFRELKKINAPRLSGATLTLLDNKTSGNRIGASPLVEILS